MPLESWLSHESVKRIERWGESLEKPLAAGLELTPLEDPFRLRKGEKLRLRVTFDGSPVEDAVVAYDGKPRGQPDPNGEINIRLRRGGFQVIQATLILPVFRNETGHTFYTRKIYRTTRDTDC